MSGSCQAQRREWVVHARSHRVALLRCDAEPTDNLPPSAIVVAYQLGECPRRGDRYIRASIAKAFDDLRSVQDPGQLRVETIYSGSRSARGCEHSEPASQLQAANPLLDDRRHARHAGDTPVPDDA